MQDGGPRWSINTGKDLFCHLTQRGAAVAEKLDESNITSERRSLLSRYRWLVFLLLAIVFLPSLLTITSSQKSALKFLHPKLNQAVHFKSAVTHWWAPVTLTDIRMDDRSAEPIDNIAPAPLLTAASITTTQPLWKLAFAMGRGADVVINQPVLNIRVRDGKTNLEDTLAAVFGESSGGSSDPIMPISVTINSGMVRLLSNEPAGPTPSPLFTTISNINGTFSTLDQTKLIPNVILVADVGAPMTLASGELRQQAVRESGVNPRIAATLDQLAGDGPLLPFSDVDMAALQSDETQPSLKMQISAAADRPDVQNLVLEARQLKLAELEPLIQRILPGTVCVGEVSCRLQAHLLEDGDADGFAGRMQLVAENIRWRNTAWAAGESLDLETVSAQGAVALAEDGLLVNDLKIRSNLLDLSGAGEVTLANRNQADAADPPDGADKQGEVNLSGRIDLARLSQMLPRTLSIADGVTAESGELQFSCRVQQLETTSPPDAVFSSSQPNFRWQLAAQNSPIKAMRDGQRLTLDSTLRLDAQGALSASGPSVSRGRITGAFGDLTADPISDGFDVRGTVNPDRLWQDIRQLIDIPRPGLTSDIAVQATLRLNDESVQLSDVQLLSSEIEVNSTQLTVYPGASLTEMFDGSIAINGTSPAIKTLIAPWHDATWLSNDSTVAAKLGADPKKQVTLEAVIRPSQTGRSSATSDSSFVIDQGRVDVNLVADAQVGQLLVERGVVEIPGLTASVTGSLGVQSGLLVVDLEADTQYDLDQLTAKLLADPRRKIQLTGVRRDVFRLQGCPSLWNETDVARYLSSSGGSINDASQLTPLKASGQLSWDGGRLYGLAVGQGAVVAELQNGLLRSEPIRCALGSGEVNVMPQWDLNTNRVQLASGSRIQNLEVTPELSGEWLGYLAPMMAEAANVRGTVSGRVQQFDYFLDSPSTSTIVGQLSLLNASASPGQSIGPLIQVLDLVDRNNSGQARELVFPNQDIPFELRNGMVRHDNLQVEFGNYLISSRGGVGLNKRVQLVLTVPLEKNVNDPTGSRTLQIPVGGTVSRPQLDTSGLLQNLGRQQLQNQVDKQLDRGLNKLFDKFR